MAQNDLFPLDTVLQASLAQNDPGQIRFAEDQLALHGQTTAYPEHLLEILKNNPSDDLRNSAVMQLKIHFDRHWSKKESCHLFTEDSRTLIKNTLLELYFSATPFQQKFIKTILISIANFDFPLLWEECFDTLNKVVAEFSLDLKARALDLLHHFVKKFRYATQGKLTQRRLDMIISKITPTLYDTFRSCLQVDITNETPENRKLYFSCIHSVLRMFYSLCHFDIPQFFDDHLQTWMSGFLTIVSLPSGISTGEVDTSTVIEKSQKMIVYIMTLFVESYSDDVKPYIEGFMDPFLQLFSKITHHSYHDKLQVATVRFLEATAKSEFRGLFTPNAITVIYNQLIIPNIYIAAPEIDSFVAKPIQFIGFDLDGSEIHTRRMACAQLLTVMGNLFPEQVNPLVKGTLNTAILDQTGQEGPTTPISPDNWMKLTTFSLLLTTFANQLSLVSRGVTKTNHEPEVHFFIQQYIIPYLQLEFVDADTDALVRSQFIKFLQFFREFIPQQFVEGLFTLCVQHIAHPQIVVHTYAGIAVDRLLSVRSETQQLISQQTFDNLLSQILDQIFTSITKAKEEYDEENEYLMKILAHIIDMAKGSIINFVTPTLNSLKNLLNQVIEKPTNPNYYHSLFDAIAALIRCVSSSQIEAVNTFASELQPQFLEILKLDEETAKQNGEPALHRPELAQYVIQLVCLITNIRGSFDNDTMVLIERFLQKEMWMYKSFVPPLTTLITTCLRANPSYFFPLSGGSDEKLQSLMYIVLKLVGEPANNKSGLQLLDCVTEVLSLPREPQIDPLADPNDQSPFTQLMSTYFPVICRQALSTLYEHMTQQLVGNTLSWLSVLMYRRGIKFMWEMVDTGLPAYPDGTPRTIHDFLNEIWVPYASDVINAHQFKQIIYGTMILLTASPLANSSFSHWDALLNCAEELLHPRAKKMSKQRLKHSSDGENKNYDIEYAPLQYAHLSNLAPPNPLVAFTNAPAIFNERMGEFVNRMKSAFIDIWQKQPSPAVAKLQSFVQ
ncbi:putative Importin-alpha re-exporter [Blattamonas nauphoetae]|uniref:Importin-alpha re-exporter n=1 Tax=Blattamonas nauphoetae TaxID=2049346 RepID=A0ABQ9YFG5_9EUKA|nr:putative Importin-alpha re-exporter [Blattamonas nauphoetae]